jgi:hypothetical protein
MAMPTLVVWGDPEPLGDCCRRLGITELFPTHDWRTSVGGGTRHRSAALPGPARLPPFFRPTQREMGVSAPHSAL